MANSFLFHRDMLDRITKLLQMRVDRGCTVAEQETAARRIGHLLMEHLELHVVMELPRENETQRRPPSSWQEAQRHQDEDARSEDPVELGFVCTLQTTDKAVLVSLPSRHRSRLRRFPIRSSLPDRGGPVNSALDRANHTSNKECSGCGASQ